VTAGPEGSWQLYGTAALAVRVDVRACGFARAPFVVASVVLPAGERAVVAHSLQTGTWGRTDASFGFGATGRYRERWLGAGVGCLGSGV
jgi:hypothetical protein